jgi:hypothetical protein
LSILYRHLSGWSKRHPPGARALRGVARAGHLHGREREGVRNGLDCVDFLYTGAVIAGADRDNSLMLKARSITWHHICCLQGVRPTEERWRAVVNLSPIQRDMTHEAPNRSPGDLPRWFRCRSVDRRSSGFCNRDSQRWKLLDLRDLLGDPQLRHGPRCGTFTFADSSTFSGYSGGPLIILGVATISGGGGNGGTNPGSGFPGNAGITNWAYTGSGSTMTINFDSAMRDFGLLWGSIDATNQITFYTGLNGTGTALATYTGSTLVGYGLGAEYYDAAGSFVNWAADGVGDDFRSIVMTDGGACCFEVDNFATNTSTTSAVPEPGTVAVMVGGGLLLGWAAKRRRARG